MVKRKKVKAAPAAYTQSSKSLKVQEPIVAYSVDNFAAVTRGYSYKQFLKVADKVTFTQKEWAGILHISERTLQRYAKDNRYFNFSVADKILQIDKVIKRGVQVFGNPDKFIGWLRSNPYMLEGRLSLQSLGSIDGINMVLTQLGRIEHGILA